MTVFLKFIVAVVLLGLFVSGVLSVLGELFSRFSSDPFPRFVRSDDESDYDDSEAPSNRGDADRAAFS